MMTKSHSSRKEIVNKRFGKLLITGLDKHPFVNVLCDCGVIKKVRVYDILKGSSKSCGCGIRDKVISRNTKHNLSTHKLYKVWTGMKERCYYKNHQMYYLYGERGVTVCAEWRHDFMSFYEWAIENGWSDGLTIDRRDNNEGYSPDNCKISSMKEQNRNKRNNKLVEYNGETKSLAQWSDELGMNYNVVRSRLRIGWSATKTFNTPIC